MHPEEAASSSTTTPARCTQLRPAVRRSLAGGRAEGPAGAGAAAAFVLELKRHVPQADACTHLLPRCWLPAATPPQQAVERVTTLQLQQVPRCRSPAQTRRHVVQVQQDALGTQGAGHPRESGLPPDLSQPVQVRLKAAHVPGHGVDACMPAPAAGSGKVLSAPSASSQDPMHVCRPAEVAARQPARIAQLVSKLAGTVRGAFTGAPPFLQAWHGPCAASCARLRLEA